MTIRRMEEIFLHIFFGFLQRQPAQPSQQQETFVKLLLSDKIEYSRRGRLEPYTHTYSQKKQRNWTFKISKKKLCLPIHRNIGLYKLVSCLLFGLVQNFNILHKLCRLKGQLAATQHERILKTQEDKPKLPHQMPMGM